jgi:16S rRNA (cytidine1402-2'-O)-methyltransferase
MANGILYIVATPIGNLGDITERALEILKTVDYIACEDTRQTMKLLKRYEISKPLISYFQHSKIGQVTKILNLIKAGNSIALASDAGTPGISDPGNKLVSEAVQAGIIVSPIPGPCAVITALSACGLPTDKFIFLGYMPHKGRTKIFDEIKNAKTTVCFYDSVHRIVKTLEQISEFLEKDRKVVVCRELTKQFESIYRGNIDEVLDQVKQMVKGEYVVIIN